MRNMFYLMLKIASPLLLLSHLVVLAQDSPWAAPGPTFTVKGGTVIASDGGKSQGGHYLLSAADLRACVLDFDIIRVSERAPRERALLVFNVDFDDRKNRRSIFLAAQTLPVGKPVHFRLVVVGERAELYRDGARTGATVTPNGQPKSPGRVGFLHYYDYDFRYENVALATLEGSGLPKPSHVKAEALRTGAVRLSWTAPELYANLLSFRVERSGTIIGQSDSNSFLDLRTRAGNAYVYRILAIGSDGSTGPASEPAAVNIAAVEPPAPPAEFRAVRRLDGSARLFWKPAPESRAESVDIFCSEEPATPQRPGSLIAGGLPPAEGSRGVPPSGAKYFSVRIADPDGARPAFLCKEAESTAPVVRAGAPFPAKHPYLQLTTEDLRKARERIEKEDWAKAAYRSMLSWADARCGKGFAMPPVDDEKHRAIAPDLARIAQAYALSGDAKYAAFVRDALLAYARLYPKLPVRSHRSRVNPYSLMEATWYQPLILAYDYIYESLAPEHRKIIEDDLLRPACALFKVDDYARDPRGDDLHFKCYNFQAWFIANAGLTGLCLRDPDLLEYAIDGPYGLKHLVAHDIRDDGLFWERSLGYHNFVMHALQPFLEAAYHCNLDLYHMQVPDDLLKDRENIANYVVDGDNGPKSIKLLYDGPFYFMFPDRSWPVYADSSRGPLSPSDFYRIAWRRYRDPKYAWLLNQRPPAQLAQWKGPQDASATLWLSWDDANLYVLADVKDDLVRNSHTDPAKWWNGDGLWLAFKFSDNPQKVYDFIYFINPGDFAKTEPALALFNRYTVAQNVTSAGTLRVGKTPEGYEARAIIPFAEIAPKPGESGPPLKPRVGMTITFDACLYDGDRASGDSVKEKMLGWSSRQDRYNTDEGGPLVFGGATDTPNAAPKIGKPPALEGPVADWKAGRHPFVINNPKHIMYDASPASATPSLFYDPPPPDAGRFEMGTGRFANNGVAMNGSTLFPSSGFAILRQDERDRDAACVAVSFGPHGGGHGHPDMLSIVLYAFGRHIIPDFGSCKYESREKAQWTSHTVSHNTIVVDEVSQYPAGAQDVQWPCDTADKQAKGSLDYFHAGPLLKVVRARSNAVYDGVEFVRTTALFSQNVLDIFDVSSAQEHSYDYVLHVDGEIRNISPTVNLAPQKEPLGAKCGYQWITNVRRAATNDEVGFSAFSAGSQDWLSVRLFPSPATEIILAEGITNSVDRKMPVFIARRKARDTRFVAALCPWSTIPAVGPPAIQKAGDDSFVSEDHKGHKKYLYLPRMPGKTVWGRFSCVAAGAAFCEAEGALQADLVKAAQCGLGGLHAELSSPASLYVSFGPDSCRLLTGLDADAEIMLKGLPAERARVALTGAGQTVPDLSVGREGGALTFRLRPLTRYEVRW